MLRREPLRDGASTLFEASIWQGTMTKFSLLPASALIAVFSVSAGFAQRPAASPTQPAPTAQANVVVPTSKLAVIYSDAFQDPKTGIAKFSSLLATLNREFQ